MADDDNPNYSSWAGLPATQVSVAALRKIGI